MAVNVIPVEISFTLDSGRPYLAPHPWDALGKPPTPGRSYDETGPVEDLERWLVLLGDIEMEYDEAEGLKAEADEHEDKARKLEKQADEMKATLIAARPEWTEALNDERDPREPLA